MYKEGQLIAVKGNIYEYGEIEDADFTKDLKLHKVYIIDIDEEGNLCHTYITDYFTTEELTNDTIELTQNQWLGIVAQLVRDIDPECAEEIAEEIVLRCFSITGLPKIHELEDYIAEYLNR